MQPCVYSSDSLLFANIVLSLVHGCSSTEGVV